MTTTTTTVTCPTWCRTDHAAEARDRLAAAEAACRWLDEHREEAAQIFASPYVTSGAIAQGANINSRREPGAPPVVDTYLVHRGTVGSFLVEVGHDRAPQVFTVGLDSVQDVDGTSEDEPARVVLDCPADWHDNLGAQQARALAALLVLAARELEA